MLNFRVLVFCFCLLTCGVSARELTSQEKVLFDEAAANGRLVQEGYKRSLDFVNGWLKYADRKGPVVTKLIGKTIKTFLWEPKNSAADNYAFMVLTTSFTDRSMYDGVMLEMLENEKRYASDGVMPVDYRIDTDTKVKQNHEQKVFGASEYVKDGLMAITEWLGVDNPWYGRMIEIQDEIWGSYASLKTSSGEAMISNNVEVNGEQLQMLPRLYWITGDKKYLDWAVRLGDHYLLGDNHPTDDFKKLKLRDHGNEIIGGLSELYFAMKHVGPAKAKEYKPHIHRMLDRTLEVCRNEHGLFYNGVNPQTGERIGKGLADNFGYVLNSFYTVYLLDGKKAYRDAVLKVLGNLGPYYAHDPFGEPMDGHADAIEGTLNLYNREPVESSVQWMDDMMDDLWAMQKKNGVIGGGHPDGNFARTTIMYCLWKSKGVTISPWSKDVRYGAVEKNGKLYLAVESSSNWKGKLVFDKPRHSEVMNMPMDYPRINQFPEWFVAASGKKYVVNDLVSEKSSVLTGSNLQDGYDVSLEAGKVRYFEVYEKSEALKK